MTAPCTDATTRGWAKLIRDPDERAQWEAAFDGYVGVASLYRPHFTDPFIAAQWEGLALCTSQDAAYLHHHGIHPDAATLNGAYERSAHEATLPGGYVEDRRVRAFIMLVHPHLTREDRDAIVAARLTLTEVDHLISTGTFDRDKVALLGGLA